MNSSSSAEYPWKIKVLPTVTLGQCFFNKFVFESIYNEPGRDWGWYGDNPDQAGHIINNMREKALNRYSKDKLIQMKICTGNCTC